MRVLTLAGSGNQRGVDYGREDAQQIASAATALKAHLAASGHPPGALLRRLANSPLTVTAATHLPDLWEEVTAVAHGSRIPLEDILLLTFYPDLEVLVPDERDVAGVGCSVLGRLVPGRPGRPDAGGLSDDAVPPSPPTTEVGQTVDLPTWAFERMVVLRIGAYDAPNALVMAFPGSIGLCGANDDGVAVASAAIPRLPVTQRGLGSSFVVRHLLTLRSLAEAEAFLTSVPHAAGRAYTIGAPDGLGTFEVDASGVRRVTPADATWVAHTEHVVEGSAAPVIVASESSLARRALLGASRHSGASIGDTLARDVLLDGRRWGDPRRTFGAFRAVGTEASARFIDGTALAAGRTEWTRATYS